MPGPSVLPDYARFLEQRHLPDVAAENVRLLRQLDAPILRLFTGESEAELLQLTTESLVRFLRSLAEGRADALAAERLRRWENDELEGISQMEVAPSDLILVHAARKRALLAFVPSYTRELATGLAIVQELEVHFTQAETEAVRLYARLHADNLRLAAERLGAITHAEDLQSYNEELQQQSEELQSQQEELEQLYEELQATNAHIETEVALRTAEVRQQAELLELAHDAIFVRHLETSAITYWNRGAEAMYGWAKVEAVGQVTHDLLKTEFPIPLEAIEAALMRDGYWEGELLHTRRDGTRLWVASRWSLQRDEHGKPRATLEINSDVTERKRADADLAQQRRLVESMIENLPGAFGYCDKGLVIRRVNATYAQQLGRRVEDLVGKPVFEALPEAEAQVGDVIRRVVETGEPFSAQGFPFTVVEASGPRETYWDFTITPVLDERRQVTGVLSLSFEVTPRIRLEREVAEQTRQKIEALEQADAMKDQFLSILSHELRTPINAVMGFGSILDDEVAGPLTPQQHAYLKKMLSGADNLLVLVNDLLDMSRIQAGKFTLSPRQMCFQEVASEVLANLAPLAEVKHHAVLSEVPEDLPPLWADEQRIAQVLTNLLNNAIKFTPEAGNLRVRACVAGRRLRCEVEDDGVGIGPEDVAKLFRPFTQLDMTATRKAGGTGLGLSISKALVEAHGGEIGVESNPGEGSTFWFELPLDRKGFDKDEQAT